MNSLDNNLGDVIRARASVMASIKRLIEAEAKLPSHLRGSVALTLALGLRKDLPLMAETGAELSAHAALALTSASFRASLDRCAAVPVPVAHGKQYAAESGA